MTEMKIFNLRLNIMEELIYVFQHFHPILTHQPVDFFRFTFEIVPANHSWHKPGKLKTKTMSDTITQASALEAIQSLTADQIKIPTIPVNIYLQEATDLYEWCLPDKPKLIKADLDETILDSLPLRTALCREAQAKWSVQQKMKQEAAKAWNEQSPAGFELRDQLIYDFEYAFRNSSDLMKTMALIKKGSSNALKIQSLSALSMLGKKYSEPLVKINFDLSQLDTAKALCESLVSLLAMVNNEKKTSNVTLDFRNRTYSYLKIAVDEVRMCGKYLFRKDETRLIGYKSEHLRKEYRKSVNEKKKGNGDTKNGETP
jgi:hypothetical protein